MKAQAIYKDHNNHMALVLSRNQSNISAIINDGVQRVIKTYSTGSFPFPFPVQYPIAEAAFNMMHSVFPLSNEAKRQLKEIIMNESTILSLNPETFELLGKSHNIELANSLFPDAVTVETVEELEKAATKAQLAALLENPRKKATLSELAGIVFDLYTEQRPEIVEAPKKEKKSKAPAKPRKTRWEATCNPQPLKLKTKVGKMAAFFKEHGACTAEQIAKHCDWGLPLAKAYIRENLHIKGYTVTKQDDTFSIENVEELNLI